nr:NUDIX domain-containing protein [Paenibacillus turpanensis]
MVTAFLFHNENILMIKKQASKLYDFEFWSGVGGHIEPYELNNPMKACVREIYEEAGIEEQNIYELSLRYLLFRIKEDEIRQQFVYFGKLKSDQVRSSDEGEVYWIHKDKVQDLHISSIIKQMLAHYFQNPFKQEIMVGTLTERNEVPTTQWAELKDPKIF